jgi:hypothetical protein
MNFESLPVGKYMIPVWSETETFGKLSSFNFRAVAEKAEVTLGDDLPDDL